MTLSISSNTCWESRLRLWSKILCTLVLGIGVLVLAGWQFDIELLKRIAPKFVAMNPMTAVGFLLAATSLYLHSHSSAALRLLSRLVATGVFLLGLAKFLQYAAGWQTNIDSMLFHAKLVGEPLGLPNRMAPNTALNFLLSGCALLCLNFEIKGRYPARYFSIASLLMSMLAVIGYLFGTLLFYAVTSFIPMALHTSLTFVALSLAILFRHPDRGATKVVISSNLGGVVARRLLPVAVLAPTILGYLRLLGEKAGYYDTAFGVALMVIATTTVFTAMIWWNAWSLSRADAERKKAEEKIQTLNTDLERRAAELQEANGELEAFSYSVSHDLRAPLRHIDGFADMLRESSKNSLDSRSERYLNIISESAKHMGRLIDDLLVFSRMGRAEMQRTKVNLNELLEEVIRELEPDWRGRNILWKKNPLPETCADPSMLRQVFINLIANAIKYTRPRNPAEIEIGSRVDAPSEITIFIRDNGVGFEPEYAGKLFGVFQRLHRSEEFEGTGIGLANVKRIVTRHRGRVWADGKPDHGATFYFSLPSE